MFLGAAMVWDKTTMATGNNASCPAPMKATSNGAFQHENPLDYALPLLILQICLVVAFTRFLAFLFRPLRQPRVIAEIIVSFSFPTIQIIFCFLFIRKKCVLVIVRKLENGVPLPVIM